MAIRLLFIPGFVSRNQDYKASDAVGYGITVADAIVAELPEHGVEVRRLDPQVSSDITDVERGRLEWILACYRALLRIPPDEYDAVFIFHAFQQFPQAVRCIFADLGIGAAITGYTHGSHWDPSDESRFIHYPGMELTDLANFLAMDREVLGPYGIIVELEDDTEEDLTAALRHKVRSISGITSTVTCL